jgi:hypothetical protein
MRECVLVYACIVHVHVRVCACALGSAAGLYGITCNTVDLWTAACVYPDVNLHTHLNIG